MFIINSKELLFKENIPLMNNINNLNTEHKIDLISLNEFLLSKGDGYLDLLLQVNEYKKIDYSSDLVQDYYLNNKYIYNPADYPKKLWTIYSFCEKAVRVHKDSIHYIPENIENYEHLVKLAVTFYGGALYFIKNKYKTYEICEIAVNQEPLALQHVPENIDNYYSLLKIAFKNKKRIKIYKWFPKEYIPQLMKDFPDDKDLELFLLKEYISKQVKKLLKEYYLKEK
jgi:hypothetical protein